MRQESQHFRAQGGVDLSGQDGVHLPGAQDHPFPLRPALGNKLVESGKAEVGLRVSADTGSPNSRPLVEVRGQRSSSLCWDQPSRLIPEEPFLNRIAEPEDRQRASQQAEDKRPGRPLRLAAQPQKLGQFPEAEKKRKAGAHRTIEEDDFAEVTNDNIGLMPAQLTVEQKEVQAVIAGEMEFGGENVRAELVVQAAVVNLSADLAGAGQHHFGGRWVLDHQQQFDVELRQVVGSSFPVPKQAPEEAGAGSNLDPEVEPDKPDGRVWDPFPQRRYPASGQRAQSDNHYHQAKRQGQQQSPLINAMLQKDRRIGELAVTLPDNFGPPAVGNPNCEGPGQKRAAHPGGDGQHQRAKRKGAFHGQNWK